MTTDYKSKLKGVMVCMPVGSQVTMQTTAALFMTSQALTLMGVPNGFCPFKMSDIVESRNLLLTNWFDNFPECSHLLSIDSDMGFSADLITDMVAFALAKPTAMVGVAYSKRSYPLTMVGRFLNETEARRVKGFLEMRDVGGGVTLIDRAGIERMLEHDPSISDTSPCGFHAAFNTKRIIRAYDEMLDPDNDNEKLSEDYSFCRRWRAAGGEVWANIEHKITHVGEHCYEFCAADMIAQGEEAVANAKAKINASAVPLWSEAAE